jgi:phage repressor protein C with HTH and peptisase S24 domain
MTTQTVGSRLRQIRGDIIQPDFAEQLGISNTSLGNYERDEVPPPSKLLLRLYELGFNPTWLLTGDGSMRGGPVEVEEPVERDAPPVFRGQSKTKDAQPDPAGYVFVPRYRVTLAAGAGAEVQSEQIVNWLAFGRQYLDFIGVSPNGAAVLRVKGDSMEPDLCDGDTVLIDTSDVDIKPPVTDPKRRRMYAVRNGGSELRCKIVERVLVDSVPRDRVRSCNQAYPEELLEPGSLTVLGRIRWSGRTLF